MRENVVNSTFRVYQLKCLVCVREGELTINIHLHNCLNIYHIGITTTKSYKDYSSLWNSRKKAILLGYRLSEYQKQFRKQLSKKCYSRLHSLHFGSLPY